MKLNDIYGKGGKPVSFEVFPPKSNDGNTDGLIETLRELEEFGPALISVTYGAGGSSRASSPALVKRIRSELKTPPMPHFTCVCSSRDFIGQYIRSLEDDGIENILALRGDPPQDGRPNEGDFRYADELTRFIRENTDLAIGTAGYPEGHKEAKSLDEDTECLKRKIEAGACAVFTQLFFDNEKFFEYLERTARAGISVPMIPGMLPPKSLSQIRRMTEMCGASIPKKLENLFEKYPSGEDAEKAGTEYCLEQCSELLENGAAGLHFYTMNQSNTVSKIIRNLNLK